MRRSRRIRLHHIAIMTDRLTVTPLHPATTGTTTITATDTERAQAIEPDRDCEGARIDRFQPLVLTAFGMEHIGYLRNTWETKVLCLAVVLSVD